MHKDWNNFKQNTAGEEVLGGERVGFQQVHWEDR